MGRIFDIKRLALHDGPGIRTTVFLKGCSLCCKWCHNPESISSQYQIKHYKDKCRSCNPCTFLQDNNAVIFKDNKFQVDANLFNPDSDLIPCPYGAMDLVGKEYTPKALFDEVIRDFDFYVESNGGVTFSGGEPLLQAELIKDVSLMLKEKNVHIAIDTAGYVDFKAFNSVIPTTDLFLYDIKTADDNKHVKWTGRSNKKIIENLLRLDEYNVPIYVRIPVISGVNDAHCEMEDIKAIIATLKNVKKVTLLKYHKMGQSKYTALGMKNEFVPAYELLDHYMDELRSLFRSDYLNENS